MELAFMAFAFGEHATWLAVLVYALARGGPRQVGVIAVVMLLPGVVLAPLAAYAGDRFAPQRALAAGYLAQCLAMGVTAAAMWADSPWLAYAAATASATCITFTRPVMGSLLPVVTHAPADLVAANVVTGFIEQVGLLAGPLVAGLLMAMSTPASVFAAASVATGLGAVLVFLVEPVERVPAAGSLKAREVMAEAFRGFVIIRRSGVLRALIWLLVCAGIVKGIGDVVFVTFANGRLGGGGGQSGLLAAAYGLGAILGALGITRLARGRAAGRPLLLGAALCGVPLLALAAIGHLAPALVAFTLLGAGESLLHMTSTVTIQRRAPLEVLARIFGIGEGLQMGAIAFGSLAVTVIVARSSLATAFVVLGLVTVAAVLVGVVVLRRHDDDAPPVDQSLIERLLDDPVFAPLPAPIIERLSRSARRMDLPADAVVVAEGAPGDLYYLLCGGVADVTIGGRPIRELGAGHSFGEVALLRDVPRSATVTARTPLELIAVPRDEFLEAVTGHPRSHRTVTSIVDAHLAA
jgi:MFS family permease